MVARPVLFVLISFGALALSGTVFYHLRVSQQQSSDSGRLTELSSASHDANSAEDSAIEEPESLVEQVDDILEMVYSSVAADMPATTAAPSTTSLAAETTALAHLSSALHEAATSMAAPWTGPCTGEVTCEIKGGLGNQIFIYTLARLLAYRLGGFHARNTRTTHIYHEDALLRLYRKDPNQLPVCTNLTRGVTFYMSSQTAQFVSDTHHPPAAPTQANLMGSYFYQKSFYFYPVRKLLKETIFIDFQEPLPSDMEGLRPDKETLVVHLRLRDFIVGKPDALQTSPPPYSPDAFGRGVLDTASLATIIDGIALPHVWVVTEKDWTEHPLPLWLKSKYNARIISMLPLQDFTTMSRAHTLLLSPASTFSWWAGVIGQATTVHFPILWHARPSPRTPQKPGESILIDDDSRYVYHDIEGRKFFLNFDEAWKRTNTV